ncbi:MAG: pyruvate, phosphate dikinase [Betaproteobacteria bacterium]|nr:pyruvate, phosphate dikinase [Betaproteobacteria bacterium]
MNTSSRRWICRLDGNELPGKALIGGKAWSIAHIRSLGLNVPPAFVITTEACAAFLASGDFPPDFGAELAINMSALEADTGRSFGHGPQPLLVSVRSGAPISMPGMMDTVLNLGMNDVTENALGLECGDESFARDTHRRFLHLFGEIVLKAELPRLPREESPAQWREAINKASRSAVPEDVMAQLRSAIRAVFESWNSRRAKRYREHHGIPHHLGTAVTVQAMVFGNLDAQSGTGVLFSRNPLNGDPAPFGEYLPQAQGEDVVSGKFTPRPLSAMLDSVPEAMHALLDAARVLERANKDVQDIEFTVERGRLFLLQARAAKLAPQAAVRTAIDMVGEGLVDPATAIQRISPDRIRILLAPRLPEGADEVAELLARGEGACPGVGIGVVVTDSEEAERRAADGDVVVLARPTTSPDDLHGMIASSAVITEEGGSTSHSAVVSRALGIPCVVGCGAGSLAALTGRTVTVDGQRGRIYAGALEIVVPDERADPALVQLTRWAEALSPLKVLRPGGAPHDGVTDLSHIDAAADPAQIAQVLAGFPGIQGAKIQGAMGGAIASEEGVRAALAAGLKFIVTEPVLPALLAAAQAVAAQKESTTEKRHHD